MRLKFEKGFWSKQCHAMFRIVCGFPMAGSTVVGVVLGGHAGIIVG